MHARNIRRDVNFPRKKEKRAETGAKSKSSRCAFAATKPPCIDPATPTQTPTPHHGWPPPSPKNFPTRCIVASLSYSPHSSATVSRPTLFRSTQIRSTAGEEGSFSLFLPPRLSPDCEFSSWMIDGSDATTNRKGTIRRFRVYRLYPIPVDGRDKPMIVRWTIVDRIRCMRSKGEVVLSFFFFFEGKYCICTLKVRN